MTAANVPLFEGGMPRWPPRRVGVPVLILAILLGGGRHAAGAVIPVTSLEQKISSTGGCSLQEAIYSANFDSSVAISGYSGGNPVFIPTGCVPGSGDDIIVLPAGAVLPLSKTVDDAINPAGPTATPLITSTITIQAYGATLQRTGSQNYRLFTVGNAGHLTIRRAYIKGFRAQGGNGGKGGGGGMGAGGAVYVMGGNLVIESSTFEANVAQGGTGGVGESGGGGGTGGHGGSEVSCDGGTGGGGARGNGGRCSYDPLHGGGGGGTVSSAPFSSSFPALGGFACGGQGGHSASGQSAPCPGGGGGGGGEDLFQIESNHGGSGNYGGGGGGGARLGGGNGGRGGFGGGGGASGTAGAFGEDGGNGGFGGGGGVGTDGFVTDGDPGNGGFFAGNANGTGGGGGAGLGGAIFNDSGSVVVSNSTFAGNTTGGGFSEKATDGASGGGAIFVRNGHLAVLNATISGGLAHIGGGILVVQDSPSAPTSFDLRNSIIASNGEKECAITGFSIGASFVGNLIESNADGSQFFGKTFVGCGLPLTSSDPQLGPLQNNGGVTPTMAIPLASPARDLADPGTSLTVDQRRQQRPAHGGYDIGAFELCLEGVGKLQMPCPIIVGAESGEEVQLTIHVEPPGGGTTVPAAGTLQVAKDSVVALKAMPSPGFRFTGWSPNVTNPGQPSTTVFMNAPQFVTANFAVCDCATDVSASIAVTRGGVTLNPVTKRYVQTVTLKNTSTSAITGPISLVLDRLTANVGLFNATGSTAVMLPAGSPYQNATTTLAPGQSVAVQLQFTNLGNIAFAYETRVLAGPGSR